jgi:hypothetical protein
MNYSESQSLRLDQLRTGVTHLLQAQSEASSIRFAREGLVTNFLSSVFSRASVALSDFVTAVYPKADTALAASFIKTKYEKMEALDYNKLRTAQLSTMEGFIGKYAAYGQQILTSLSYEVDILSPQLREFKMLLGGIINNHDDRKALLSLEKKYKDQREVLDGFDTEMSKFWQRGSYKSIQTVGDVIDRSADLVVINKDANLIAEKLKQVSFERIQSKVSEVRDLIRIAIESIDNGNLKEVSDAQLKNLAHGVMALAESVEFFGVVLYRANVYINAVDRLNTVAKKVG